MNRRELVNAIAAHTGQNNKDVDATLLGFTEVVTAVAAKGEPVIISGFAKFVRRDSPARMGRNPATGEAIKIKASKKARITPLKAFKDAVLSPSAAPKLAAALATGEARRVALINVRACARAPRIPCGKFAGADAEMARAGRVGSPAEL